MRNMYLYIYIYPPTPAFAKAGAAPGTTAGVEPIPFPGLQTSKNVRGSFDKALCPQAFGLRALKPAVCIHGPLLLRRSSLPFACPQTRAASTRHCGHRHLVLEL